MKKLALALAPATFIALLTLAVSPVQAALINFQFTTTSGGEGTFTLDTDTKPATEPAILQPDIGVVGILYPQAISNYSFSSPYLTFNNKSADWIVAPSVTSDFIGLPPEIRGVLSGPTYPSSCTTTPPNFTCILDVAVIYSGNLSELPVLSDDPLSYSRIVGIDFSDPIVGELRLREGVVNSQVVARQSVPESNLSSGILAFGITAFWLLVKRKSNKNSLITKVS